MLTLAAEKIRKSLPDAMGFKLIKPTMILYFMSTESRGFIDMEEVFSFHDGIAAVRDHRNMCYHIDEQGQPLYSARFKRTFGFYAGARAAVMDNSCNSFHISYSGEAAYPSRFEWCGNFHRVLSNEFKAPVRHNGKYFYINEHGHIISGPYLYCGDPNSAGESVVWNFNSECTIINNDGSSWCKRPLMRWLDAKTPHKGIAAVRDLDGWFFMDKNSKEMGRGRYEEVEPHYNGLARVKTKSQKWLVVDEQGEVVLDLGQSTYASAAELETISKLYWKSLALKMIINTNLLQKNMGGSGPNSIFEKILLDVSEEMGLVSRQIGKESIFQLSKKGLLLNEGSIIGDRCRYWLQTRYLHRWCDGLESIAEEPDVFRDNSSHPGKVEISQRVLNSYAATDWSGIAAALPVLDNAPITIVDIGGGQGALLRALEENVNLNSATSLVCVDRPEVVRMAQSNTDFLNSRVRFQAGDLFEGPLPPAPLYLMSRVLHDWSDERVIAILQHIHDSTPAKAQLCVIDRVCDMNSKYGLLSLHMYLLQKSHERTQSEWELLFQRGLWHITNSQDFNNHKVFTLSKVGGISTLPLNKPSFQKNAIPVITKAVIPIAGLGSRMAPQSGITPKALLPIIQRLPKSSLNLGSDQIIVKPALDFLLNELMSEKNTITDICIIASPKQVPLLDLFLEEYKIRNVLKSERNNVTVVVQDVARGLGDSLLHAENFVNKDPFLLALGDHIYSADSAKNVLSAYYDALAICEVENGKEYVGLSGACLCTNDEIACTGLLGFSSAALPPPLGSPWKVDKMVEKPTDNHVEFELHSCFPGKYASQLGMDILPPAIIDALKQKRLDIIGECGEKELDLRGVMKDSMQKQGLLYACILDGHRLDIGNPRSYMESLQRIYSDNFPLHPSQCISPKRFTTDNSQPLVVFLKKLISMPSLSNECRHVLSQLTSPTMANVHVASAPGRMDLMGGFADYSGSKALQYPTAQRVVTMVQKLSTDESSSGGKIHMISVQVPSLDQMSGIGLSESINIKTAELKMSQLFVHASSTMIGALDLGEYLRSVFQKNELDGRWPLYLVGVLRAMLEEKLKEEPSCYPHFLHSSFNIVTISDLTWNSGLASSAAVETATAIAIGKALELPATVLQPVRLALLCQQVEHAMVGSNCGLMDHLAVAHTFEPCTNINSSVIEVSCRMPPSTLPTNTISLPSGVSVVAFESGVRRSIAGPQYKRVRTATAIGKAILDEMGTKVSFLCDMTPSKFDLVRKHLPMFLSGNECLRKFGHFLPESVINVLECSDVYPIRNATAHPIEENFRVRLFMSILRSMHDPRCDVTSCVQQLGELMSQAHLSYTKCGLGVSQTDLLVDLLTEKSCNSGVIGAKVSGGGSGGAVVALLRNGSNDTNQRSFLQTVQKKYSMQTGLHSVFRSGSSGEARYHGHLFESRRGLHILSRCIHTFETRKPRVLYVNHGYPPNYNGGSEVYAQTLAIHMRKSGEFSSVHVLAREDNPYRPDFEIRRTFDQLDGGLPVLLMNYSREAPYFRFVADPVDSVFRDVLEEIQPDIVHFHHLNHLSLSLPVLAKEYGAGVFYTMHDFWLMCPRGQFLINGVTTSGGEPWQQCDGQDSAKCAHRCYVGRYATGMGSGNSDFSNKSNWDPEQEYWTKWIDRRMMASKNACKAVDYFLAPSRHLYSKFIEEFRLPSDKIVYEPYGFDRSRFSRRKRRDEVGTPYVFAYIGRHQPAKGVNLLVEAALQLLEEEEVDFKPRFQLRIYGRLESNSTRAIQRMIAACPHPRSSSLVFWEAEYSNADIVETVFNNVDCIVVPSIWDENAPLVIHEAFQSRIPVITSDRGGMGELVRDEENGLTFTHRSVTSLKEALHKAMAHPAKMQRLANRGYLNNIDGQVPCINDHVRNIVDLYRKVCPQIITDSKVKIPSNDSALAIQKLDSPWRVTFDTNPDDCNFQCTMCEQHSEHSPHQKQRKASGIRRRRMDINIVRDVVRELAPRGLKEIIPTTMGEPLQYKEFPQFLDICREFGVKLNLTTNGSFFGRGVEAWARLIVPFL